MQLEAREQSCTRVRLGIRAVYSPMPPGGGTKGRRFCTDHELRVCPGCSSRKYVDDGCRPWPAQGSIRRIRARRQVLKARISKVFRFWAVPTRSAASPRELKARLRNQSRRRGNIMSPARSRMIVAPQICPNSARVGRFRSNCGRFRALFGRSRSISGQI